MADSQAEKQSPWHTFGIAFDRQRSDWVAKAIREIEEALGTSIFRHVRIGADEITVFPLHMGEGKLTNQAVAYILIPPALDQEPRKDEMLHG